MYSAASSAISGGLASLLKWIQKKEIGSENQYSLNFYIPYGPNFHRTKKNEKKWSLGWGDEFGEFSQSVACLFFFIMLTFNYAMFILENKPR